MFKKVRITKVPSMAYGGRVFNQVAPNALPDKSSKPPVKVKDTLQPVAREGANIEAEKGETAFFLDVNGLPAHYKIGGKRHTKGGTPLNVPEDTFIFSDTRSLIIKDPDILAQFGETKPKTPAEIAKKYDLNSYRKVLADRDTDALHRKTAEQMIQNYTLSLGKLALIQESMKGFPQGIPTISQPYMVVNNINPEDILPMSNASEEQGEGNQPESQEMEQQPQAPQQGPPQQMMQQEMMPPMEGGPEMGFAGGGFYGDPPVKMDPYRVSTTDTMYNSSVNNKNREKYRGNFSSASTIQNLKDPIDINRMYTKEGRLGSFDYFSSPDSKDITFIGPFGRRHEIYTENPIVNAIGQGFIDPMVDRASGANPFATNRYANLQRFLGTGNSQGIYAAGGSTGKRKVRVVSLPTYGNGGPKKKTGSDISDSGSGQRKTVLEFSPQFIQDLATLAEEGKVTGDFPQVEGWTPEFQQRNADQYPVSGRKNIYGDRDWWKENSEERLDFERRHKWFLDQNPGWNPENQADVKKFQRAYCARMKEYGAASCWFVGEGKGGSGIRIDGVFGEHTWSAPSLNEAPPEEEIPVEEKPKQTEQPPQDIPVNPLIVPPQKSPAFEYYPQDVLNLATAMTSQIPNPKTNYYALQFRGMDPAYLTPDYSPYQEAMNQRMQGLQSYGSRQGFGADASAAQSKTAEAAAQHNLEVANRNVGIYNSAQQYNAEISNKNAMYNAEQRQADFDTREAYKADRIKAINKKRADVAMLYNTMLDNATAAYNLNIMYPHYQTSPSRGGLVTFYNGDALKPDQDAYLSELDRQIKTLRSHKFTNSEIARILSGKNADRFNEEEDYYNRYDVPYGYLPHSPMNQGQ
jgi:hypothetical protein